MADPEQSQRRHSDVLDAIFEQVEGKAEQDRPAIATAIFRDRALRQLDVATQIDNQLPLVARRSWLLLLGAGLLVVAFLIWAALTPSVTMASGVGRVLAAPGLVAVTAPAAGTVLDQPVGTGSIVTAGQEIARVQAAARTTDVLASRSGTVWQVFTVPGATVAAGAPMVTLYPPGSDRALLLAIPEGQAGAITPGMTVEILAATKLTGKVTEVAPPVPPAVAVARTAIDVPGSNGVTLVTVALPSPLVPGTQVTANVILSQSTVLGRLWGGQ